MRDGEGQMGKKVALSPITCHSPRLLRLGWLLPATYTLHILEEWRGGEGFPAWFSRTMGARLTVESFLSLNRAGLAGMLIGVGLAYAFRKLRWLLVSFATVVTINGLAHVTASVATRTYSPGLFTGAFLWLPLGTLVLDAGRRALSRRVFIAGVAVGVLMHAVVTLLAFTGVGAPSR